MISGFVKLLRAGGVPNFRHFKGNSDNPWTVGIGRRIRRVGCRVVSWRKPLSSCYKLNMDTSIFQGQAFGGGLLRDRDGKLVFAFIKKLGRSDVLMAEILSFCRYAVIDVFII